MTQAKTTLLDKLLKAQESAKAVGKHGRNEHQKYDYARAEDVIREAQGALHGAGLIGVMAFDGAEEREVTNKGGTPGIYITLAGVLRISDPESAEVFEVPTFGAGVDYPGDKAVYKAMTGAAKYGYASALGIPFTDDPENETADTGRAKSSASKDKPKTEPKAKGEASKAQKAAITRRCNELDVTDDHKPALIEWAGGMPLTSEKADKLVKLLMAAQSFADVWEKAELPNPAPAEPTAESAGETPTLEDAVADGGAEALGLTEHDDA